MRVPHWRCAPRSRAKARAPPRAPCAQKYVGKSNSINPDMSFAGVMPLHLAVEEGMTDMAAYLIHWKASKTRLDGSKKYPLQYAKARAASKDPKIKENGEILVKCVAPASAACCAAQAT